MEKKAPTWLSARFTCLLACLLIGSSDALAQPSLLADIAPGSLSSIPSQFTHLSNGTTVFAASDGSLGRELWGRTPGEVFLLEDINPGPGDGLPFDLWMPMASLGDRIVFLADDGIHGAEPWVTDGTPQGTQLLMDIAPGPTSSNASELTTWGNYVVFSADDGIHGNELWITDGTTAGTMMVADLNAGSNSSFPGGFTPLGGSLFFHADDGIVGDELWKLPEPFSPPMLVEDINPGPDGSFPFSFAEYQGMLFFSAFHPMYGYEPWFTDGTMAGTGMLSDICQGTCSSSPHSFTSNGSYLIFGANDNIYGDELWRTDGTPNGTMMVMDIRSGSASSFLGEPTPFNDIILFTADDGVHGLELWRTDGTPNGTMMVQDINPGPDWSWPYQLTNYGGGVWFNADDGTSGYELWVSDGTAAGTMMYDILPGPGSSDPFEFSGFGGTLFFSAEDEILGREPFIFELCTPQTEVCDGIDNDCDGLVDCDDPDLVDEAPPSASCVQAPLVLILDEFGEAEVPAQLLDSLSADNCLIDTMWSYPPLLDCSVKGDLVPVQLVVQDCAGLQDTCVAQVRVIDTIPPIVNCFDPTIYLDSSGSAVLQPYHVTVFIGDNCAVEATTISPDEVNCLNAGDAVPVSVVVTDVSGNVDECIATVSVADTLPPVANCYSHITLVLDSAGHATLTPDMADSSSWDNCEIVALEVAPNMFDCAVKGDLVPVQLTVEDASGNQSTCHASVTVEDQEPPVALCASVTVYVDQNGLAIITPDMADAGSTDNCAVVSLDVVPPFVLCDTASSVIPGILLVEDASGNADQCAFDITVIDTIAPMVTCNDLTIQLDSTTLHAEIDASDVATAIDNCPPVNLFVDPMYFDCEDVGSVTVEVEAIDADGNSSDCTATVFVEEPPLKARCISQITVFLDPDLGEASITIDDIDDGSSFNCTGTAQLTPSTFDCSHKGLNTVTLILADAAGNSTQCTATVNVVDDTPPAAFCDPQPIDVYLDNNGFALITPLDVDDGSFDNCAISQMQVAPNAFNCATQGTFNVTLTVTDPSGNQSDCTAQVNVMDADPPTAICQPGLVVTLGALGTAFINGAMLDAGSSDNCGIVQRVAQPNFFDCNDIGMQQAKLVVTDQAGNTDDCFTTVMVVDNQPPTAVCLTFGNVMLDSSGMASITPAMVDAGSQDNCAISSRSVAPDQFFCADLGLQSAVLLLTDPSGNQSQCTAQFNIVDTIPPAFRCDTVELALPTANDTVMVMPEQLSNDTMPAWDNCGIDTILLSRNTFWWTDTLQPVRIVIIDVADNADTCYSYVRTRLPNALDDPRLEGQFRLMPNPVNDRLQIEWTLPAPAALHFQLYDADGTLVTRFDTGGRVARHGSTTIDLSALPRGLYLLRISDGHASRTEKVIRM